jgi:putrescine---pyruvate transaminase
VRRLEPALSAAPTPPAGHDLVTEVRTGAGLLGAVEISASARERDPGLAPRLVGAIRERGVITRLLRGVALQVSPPFVITEDELARIGEVFRAALDDEAASAKGV